MGKNKSDEDTDKFSALEILINFHSIMCQSDIATTAKGGMPGIITKLEEHILNLLNQLDFSIEEQETEE